MIDIDQPKGEPAEQIEPDLSFPLATAKVIGAAAGGVAEPLTPASRPRPVAARATRSASNINPVRRKRVVI